MTFLTFVAGLALSSPAADKASRPNIIFILADDVGFGNVSCYGADKFKTPKIDALAKSGIRFEHCYAAPLCGPSRAAILTGRYAFRTGMTGNDSGPLMKPANEIMIPKILKPAGYVTAHVGKWSQLPLQPSDWGFDEYLRFQGSGQYWREQNAHYTVNGKQTDLPEGKYLPDLMHEFLVDFITQHRDQPFYVHYAMSHIHGKILRTPDSAPDSKDFYADNIAYMDKLVGKLVADLDRLKLREKTLLIFVGDNGTAKNEAERSTVNGKHISGHKGEMLEGGSLVPMIASWPGTAPAGKISKNLLDFSDYFPTFAELAGAKLPEGVTLDGHNFAPELRGEKGESREWIFVELGKKWYVREADWKLNRNEELFDMKGAPFEEKLVASDPADAQANAAKKRLQAVLDQLDPAAGKMDAGDGSGKHAGKAKNKLQKTKP
ncbi:MAG: sulfatase-like hydrolase/transferase [Verrucomicrobiota bacterium]|nr:sulfatase-like hydrolase/transferase [Verrucomicrobiota bacterium]